MSLRSARVSSRVVQVGFSVEIERRRRAPQASEHDFGVLGRTEGGHFGGCGGFGLFGIHIGDGINLRLDGVVAHGLRLEGHIQIRLGIFAAGNGPEQKNGVAGVSESRRARPW